MAYDTLPLALACVLAAVAALAAGLTLVRSRAEAREARMRADRLEGELARARAALEEARAQLGTLSTWAAGESAAGQQRFEALSREFSRMSRQLDDARRETSEMLERGRVSTESQLERVREVVDEKLTRTLNDRLATSFKQVSDQLEAVYTGLGDMRSIASGVGDLKRVLSNVKTRGILGEVQLGAILTDILAPDQYAENVATKPGASERVEFAVRLPVEGGGPVWLPIDSKFPGDAYEHVRRAADSADAEALEAARKVLEQRVRAEARDIRDKYLSVPATTNFGILFLPFEGLYAEVVDRPGLIESLQRDLQVVVAGPSTMAVILNSLQMSYQTFAFQRRADEIQRVLAAVKAEFPRYQAELRRALKQIETAGRTVDGIINTRTNVMERKLQSVTALDDAREAAGVIGYDAPDALDSDASL